MGLTTSKLGLRYPVGGDATNPPLDIEHLAEDIDTLAVWSGIYTTAGRDALAGTALFAGHGIYNTTNARYEIYNGASWQSFASFVGSIVSMTTVARDLLAGSELYAGRAIYNSTNAQYEYYTGAAWSAWTSIMTFTTTQRNALAGTQLWTGRIIYNSTTTRLEAYDGAAWGPAANLMLKGFSEVVNVNAAAGGAMTIDCSLGNYFKWTLTSNITSIAFTNVPASGCYTATIKLIQGGAGSFTVVWPASVKSPSGTAPTLSTTAGKVDIVTLLTDDGGTLFDLLTGGLDFR